MGQFLRLFINVLMLLSISREENHNILTYSVTIDDVQWSSVFRTMVNAKQVLHIEDYSISQNSTEHAKFLAFKHQPPYFMAINISEQEHSLHNNGALRG